MRIRTLAALFFFLFSAALLTAQTRTIRPITVQQKLALVVGNAGYPRSPLVNPVRDAESIASELRALGFTVTVRNNLTLRDFSRLVDDFAGHLQSGDLALFYYSGHGMQVDHENYLLPIDFEAATEADVPYAAYPANRVRDKLERSGARLRVMILDACRDNPYKSSRGGPSGLAPMGATAEGTMIAFATGDNNTASDNPGQSNGLFTQHLISALREPGLEIHDIFKRVKEEVYYESNKQQNPFTYDDLAGSFYFRTSAASSNAPVATPAVPSNRPPDAEAWEEIRSLSDAHLFEEFLREYPSSQYAGAARLKVASLRVPSPVTNPPAAEPGNPGVKTKVNPKDGLKYVWIPAGQFRMGCSQGDTGCYPDERPHVVSIAKGFWLGQTPVTQAAYSRVAGTNPSAFKGDSLPVDSATWPEAEQYCKAVGGRLPTEAEWEYAARAGNSNTRYGDLNAIAWYRNNSGGITQAVGTKAPNSWDLYDMLGNVWQWTADWYGPTNFAGQQESADPKGPPNGDKRVLRGGSWNNDPSRVRVSLRNRDWRGPNSPRAGAYGLRCAVD